MLIRSRKARRLIAKMDWRDQKRKKGLKMNFQDYWHKNINKYQY